MRNREFASGDWVQAADLEPITWVVVASVEREDQVGDARIPEWPLLQARLGEADSTVVVQVEASRRTAKVIRQETMLVMPMILLS